MCLCVLQVLVQEYGEDFKPLFEYTSIPLDTSQCVSFTDICLAMQAIADNIHIENVYYLESPKEMCSLSSDCLSIICGTINITLSPCNYAVTLSTVLFDYTFRESGTNRYYSIYYFGVDVTLVKLQNGRAIGLQVKQSSAEWVTFFCVIYFQTRNSTVGCMFLCHIEANTRWKSTLACSQAYTFHYK